MPVTEGKTGIDKIYLAKTNVSIILKKLLYKFKEGEKREVFPGFHVERKGFLDLVNNFVKEGRNVYILDSDGEDIRTSKIEKDPIFVLGDHRGLPLKELKRLKKVCIPLTIGKRTYFASQTLAVLNNEIDRREDLGLL